MPRLAYVNGRFLPHRGAQVHIEDRGYQFADGVYEVVPVTGGRLLDEALHLDRLDRSLGELSMRPPMGRRAMGLVMREVLRRNRMAEGLLYIQVTRGVAMRDHVMPTDITPTVFAMASPMRPPTPEQLEEGVACVTADDFRWEKAHIKSTSLLGSVFARQISFDAGALETVMFRHGYLSEAAASNVWVVKDGTVFGTPKDNLVLEGIRYGLIEELCKTLGIPYQLKRISRDEVLAADELLLSSATKEVLPVTLLDGEPVGQAAHRGQPGPIARQLYTAYQDAKAASTD